MRRFLLFALLLTFATPALASDGVLEINQTCAVETGCFSGDTPGFPVTISASGSYRLTSVLTPPDLDTMAVGINADDVTLDLGGFGIEFPGSGCLSQSICPQGSGDGIRGAGGGGGGRRVVVTNGYIRNAGRRGISLSDIATIDTVRVYGCGEDGIVVGARSIVTKAHVSNCGRYGGQFGGSTVFSHSVFAFNNRQGSGGDRDGGIPTIGNVCGDGSCNPAPRHRRYFLSDVTVQGDAVLGACGIGFHAASIHEMIDGSSLHYDPVRGEQVPGLDRSAGPPSGLVSGWVRTGWESNPGVIPGTANCNLWSSTSSGHSGTIAGRAPARNATLTVFDPWELNAQTCNQTARVWCIED